MRDVTRRRRPAPEPWDYARQADLAMANGDRHAALEFVRRAYVAFDLHSR
jgi:hypothetical protein